MFYAFVKIIARCALHLYCRHLQINKRELLDTEGPLLLAANHPNSFLDAILLCTLFNRPVYSLARGDVFKNNRIARILFSLKLLPVYRVSEGVENMDENYKTFDQCKDIFRQNGIVLIFSEGKCINEWHLRPLKKGTARLAISSWEDGIPLKVLPVGINYNSFRQFGKNIHLYFGKFITQNDLTAENGYGRSVQEFNKLLQEQLQKSVYEISKTNPEERNKIFNSPPPFLLKILLFFPSVFGLILHAPLFLLLKQFIKVKMKDRDHYDSLVVALLFLSYPVYIALMASIVYMITHNGMAFLVLLILPLTAWCYLHYKKQTEQVM